MFCGQITMTMIHQVSSTPCIMLKLFWCFTFTHFIFLTLHLATHSKWNPHSTLHLAMLAAGLYSVSWSIISVDTETSQQLVHGLI